MAAEVLTSQIATAPNRRTDCCLGGLVISSAKVGSLRPTLSPVLGNQESEDLDSPAELIDDRDFRIANRHPRCSVEAARASAPFTNKGQ